MRPDTSRSPHPAFGALLRPSLLLLGATPCLAQDLGFSIDWHGPTIGLPDSFGAVPITEGDIFVPPSSGLGLGPLATPGIGIPHGPGGLWLPPGCIGHPGGTPCVVEVDALSFGVDGPLSTAGGFQPGELAFSVDEYALGGAVLFASPFVPSEAPVGDSATDLFTLLFPTPFGPLPPFATAPDHVGVVDGDGLPSGSGYAYPGTGLIEPNLAFAGLPNNFQDTGDNLDAAAQGASTYPTNGAYFSLEGPIFDPLAGFPGSASSNALGVSAADVLWAPPAGPAPVVWAPAWLLGLELTGVADDIDALMVWENGTPGFQASQLPYDWVNGATDMVLFSVRRGSAIIGQPDSIFGLPISEGDVLTAPLSFINGGLSPFPGIFVAAENLGLGTLRSGTASPLGDDDLDALSLNLTPIKDCDGDGIEDAVAIALGLVVDANQDGVPDNCQTPSLLATPFCFCVTGAPCGNTDPNAGCMNSTGAGGLLTATGTSIVGNDNLVMVASQLPVNQFGLLFMGPTQIPAVGMADGLRCVGGVLRRYLPPVPTFGGITSVGPGLVAYSIGNFPPSAWITVGSTWNFQFWYRDPLGPCSLSSNVTNAVAVTFL